MSGLDSQVITLHHYNGNDASTTITNSAVGPTWSVAGNAQIDTAQSKFGGASLLLDGNGDWVYVADTGSLEFGSGDWTVDLWVRFNSTAGYQVIYNHGYNTTGTRSILVYYGANSINVAQSDNGSNNADIGREWIPSTNTWYHVAIVRSSTAVKIFIDGTQLGADITAVNLSDSGQDFRMGSEGTSHFNGWHDEARISVGIARWTANFTPPTEEYSVDVVPAPKQKIVQVI